jgi:LacI family transcriptional regulator
VPRPASKARPITIKDVAQLAGVHPSTVSRALNPATRSMVAQELATSILQAAQKLGYQPDHLAASLRTGRSQLVGVLLPDIANPVFAPILSGITERLMEDGYSTVVADAGPGLLSPTMLLDGLIARRVDGLILATAAREDTLVSRCLERDVPVVLVNRAEAQPRVSAVVSDDMQGMQLAVDHLVALGHRKIGHIAGPQTLSTGLLRHKGFESAIRGHGAAVESCSHYATAYSREAGAAAADGLLADSLEVTAIVAANDLLALGVYDALHGKGLRCPDDISVVGHNDMPLMDLVAPALTTVRIGHRAMGREAAELLFQRMRRADIPTRMVMLTPSLVIRSSTSGPRRRS